MTPEEWASLSDNNISKAEQQCNASSTLGGVIDSVLSQCTEDIETQRVRVDLAFEKRTKEVADAKQTLEQHLAKVGLHLSQKLLCVQNEIIIQLVAGRAIHQPPLSEHP